MLVLVELLCFDACFDFDVASDDLRSWLADVVFLALLVADLQSTCLSPSVCNAMYCKLHHKLSLAGVCSFVRFICLSTNFSLWCNFLMAAANARLTKTA